MNVTELQRWLDCNFQNYSIKRSAHRQIRMSVEPNLFDSLLYRFLSSSLLWDVRSAVNRGVNDTTR